MINIKKTSGVSSYKKKEVLATDSLTGDEIFGESLCVVEDDEHAGLCNVIRHAVVSKGDVSGLFQRRRLHRVAAFSEIPR